MKDIHSGLTRILALGAAVQGADAQSSIIDLQDYNAAEILLDIGVGGIVFTETNKIEFKLTHSDDGSTFADVASGDVLGLESVGQGGIIKSLTEAHSSAGVYRFGYKGGRRYLQLSAEFSGTHGSGTPMAVSILVGHGYNQPEGDQA